MNAARALLANLRPDRTAHYVFMILLGAVFGLRDFSPAVIGSLDVVRLSAAILAVVAAYQAACVLNDFFDLTCDRISNPSRPLASGALSKTQYRVYGSVCLVLSLALAAWVGYPMFVLVVACYAVSWLYSVPPLRLKRFFPINLMLIAFASWFLVLGGYSVFAGAETARAFPGFLTLWCLAIFPFVLGVKDLRDEAGDRADGVTTLATLLGRRRAARVLAPLVLLGFVLTPTLLGQSFLWPAGLAAGLLGAGLLWWEPSSERPLFVIYALFAVLVCWTVIRGISNVSNSAI